MEIKIVEDKISLDEIKKLARESFGDMVKAVVDVEKNIMAIGGELHADAEKVLLENGSEQKDLWGINIYPVKTGDDIIEYNSLINIRPSQDNRSLDIEDENLRKKVKGVVDNLTRE